MPASVSYTYTRANQTVANPSITVTDVPAAGDILIFLEACSNTNGALTSVSGCGATWTKITPFTSTTALLNAWIGVGATGSGTITTTGSSNPRALAVFMCTGVSATVAAETTAAASGPLSTAPQAAGPGQIVIGASFTDSLTNSVTDTTPVDGWTETTVNLTTGTRFLGTVYRTPATLEDHSFTAQRTTGNTHVSQLVLGDSSTQTIASALTSSATLATVFPNRISSSFTGSGTLTSTFALPRTNLFTHPSAEGAGITWTNNVGSATLDRSSAQAWAGSESYALTSISAAFPQEMRSPAGPAGFPVVAGKEYTYSFYTRAGSVPKDVTPKITWYTTTGSAGTYISISTGSTTTNTSSGWTRHTMTATAPATAAFAAVHFRFTAMAVNEVQYIDGLLFEQSPTANPYFDGSTANAGYTYTWLGTPHASASKEVVGDPPAAFASSFSVTGTLSSALVYTRRISAGFSAAGTLTSALEYSKRIASEFSGSGTLSSVLTGGSPAGQAISAEYTTEGVLYSELFYTRPPAELGGTPLGKLVSFSVSTSAVPLNPAEGSGATPSVSSSYIKGHDPEFALGETNTLSHGAVGTYAGEIVRLSLPEGSDVASVSQDTALTLLNNELTLFPFIDAAPSIWTAARAIEYWTQQCGLFYDKVPGDCIAYASGFGHSDSYGAGTTARFYEKLAGGTTATALLNGRSVKTLGSAVTGTTAFHELPKGNVPVSVPTHRKLVASIGLGLRGTGRTTTVAWNLIDSRERPHTVTLAATSAGAITASIGGVPVASGTVAGNADYRVTFSIERTTDTSVVGKLIIHTDDLAGTGSLVFESASTGASYTLPAVTYLTSITHASAGGSGAEMLRWGTYLSVTQGHPRELPAVQKAFSPTGKEFGFVSGFEGNVWALLNEYCAITRQDVSFLDAKLTLTPRIAGLTVPVGNFSRFSRDAERREKYKQVAVVNKQSKAVNTDDAVLWRADSVFQVSAREVFETTVQTGHSILSLVQPVAVAGILPFPYIVGGGQYVVTGADGYIIAPEWWNDNGGKVVVSLTGKDGEIAIKIIAPALDTVRAPYRISEGEGDRPALYVSGSGILNDPVEVHVGTGAKNAKEGFDQVYESPFIATVQETYDTAVAMASEYSSSVAEVSFEIPNDFYTPSRFGQYPAGTRFTDGKRNYRITDASQSHSKVSGNAVPHTTIGDYVASYPEGATIADELARHAGRTIKQFNISPLKGN